jgi:hypothetical protein
MKKQSNALRFVSIVGMVAGIGLVTPLAHAGDDLCEQGAPDGFCSEYDDCTCSDCAAEPDCQGGGDDGGGDDGGGDDGGGDDGGGDDGGGDDGGGDDRGGNDGNGSDGGGSDGDGRGENSASSSGCSVARVSQQPAVFALVLAFALGAIGYRRRFRGQA